MVLFADVAPAECSAHARAFYCARGGRGDCSMRASWQYVPLPQTTQETAPHLPGAWWGFARSQAHNLWGVCVCVLRGGLSWWGVASVGSVGVLAALHTFQESLRRS